MPVTTTTINEDDTQVLSVLKAKHVGDSLNTIDLEEVSTTSSYSNDSDNSDDILLDRKSKTIVRFDQASNEIHEVVSARCDLSKEEVRATWYTKNELASMLKRMVTDAINLAKPNCQKPDETNETALGLELYSLSKIGKARQQRLRKTRQCVLQEQARLKRKEKAGQVSAGVLLYQQQQLRRVSRRCSRKCREAASARGKQDEAAVSENLQRFRIVHVSSCLMLLSSSPPSSSDGAQQQQHRQDPYLQEPQLVPALQFFKRLLLD